MIINEINDEIKSKARNAIVFAYNNLLKISKSLNIDLENSDEVSDRNFVFSYAAYKDASRDSLTYAGSTIACNSYFLSKEANSIEERKNTLIYKICDEVINVFLIENDFSMNKCLTIMDKIFEIMHFRENIHDFSYGNAQKWVNMAVKYYFVYKTQKNYDGDIFQLYVSEGLSNYVFFPVDRKMIETVTKDFGKLEITNSITSPNESPDPWSSCNSKITFIEYWKFVEEKCTIVKPLIYEICNWKPNTNN